jgi:hypothetical protein
MTRRRFPPNVENIRWEMCKRIAGQIYLCDSISYRKLWCSILIDGISNQQVQHLGRCSFLTRDIYITVIADTMDAVGRIRCYFRHYRGSLAFVTFRPVYRWHCALQCMVAVYIVLVNLIAMDADNVITMNEYVRICGSAPYDDATVNVILQYQVSIAQYTNWYQWLI